MRGRMIHGRRVSGELYEEPQDYDIHGRTIYAVDRGGLNKRLLDELEAMPNVKLFFNHKLTGADFRKNLAWFEAKASSGSPAKEIEVAFDFMIGADGAHSAVRYHLMKYTRMNYQQEYIDTLWCEFTIRPKATKDPQESTFRISPNHLHIWPGKEHMFIAIPSLDGSFTCTLFLPSEATQRLEDGPDSSIPTFFDAQFPGVTSLIDPSDLISQFRANPHLPLISIKCQPYHFSHSVVIVGDAAHAMVPFYGQGMNAGLEDVRVLFSIIDRYLPSSSKDVSHENGVLTSYMEKALQEYSEFRAPDAQAINDLALQNYTEMRASVVSPSYRLRKFLEETISKYLPRSGWRTKYSRVSFGNERYSEIVRQSERQGKILVRGFVGLCMSPVVLGAAVAWWRWRSAYGGTRYLAKVWGPTAVWKTWW